MKKFLLLLIFTLIFFSCEKEYLIPENEVPEWLKAEIKQDEKIIKESPKLMNAHGVWLRYKWQNEFYFEYHNLLSSTMHSPVSAKKDTIHLLVGDKSTDYYKEKCCRQYVWKGPYYKELPGI